MDSVSRRRYLAVASAVGTAGLAGCGGGMLDREDPEEAELRERIRELEAENEDLRTTVAERETDREHLETRLAEERAESRRLRRRLDNRTAEVDTLRSRVDAQEERITELQATISLLKESGPDSRFDEAVRSTALEVGEGMRESIVFLEHVRDGRRSHGTGFFFDRDLVVTNSHVVGDATDVTCWTLDGESIPVESIGRVESQNPDVAALRATDDTRPALSAGDSTDLEADQPLVQVGHPGSFGNWVISLGPFVERARFRSADGSVDEVLKTLVPTIGGNSGSPLVTLDGDVVGLTYGGIPRSRRPLDDPPEPAPPTVYESVAPDTYSLHETVERVESQLDEWL
ncbi:trypsin-like peptidase domain-containing protein [Halorussus salilacus]|uniref:trypsin-like peptidase domain-containing protein n=1 Tax=Halorussus salilacus TaxID=2953750 RepID=UPI00209E50C6|nr:trypsin-like peptidase domain-containing protein [Halorussus salilacus]USZ68247.1 trypsin-like peptidase domain-containing protein [Halorussus salilacus]